MTNSRALKSIAPRSLLAAAAALFAQAPAWAQDAAAADPAANTAADGGLPTVPVETPADEQALPERSADPLRRNLLQVGLFYINNLDKSRELHSSIKPGALAALGLDSEFTSAGTGASVSSEETLALIYTFSLTNHIGLKFEGGIPARFSIQGKGIVEPTGNLVTGAAVNLADLAVDLADPANNPLAKVTQWSPVMILQYTFRDPDKTLRPYLGVGMTYTWFEDVKLDKEFKNELATKFGRTLAAGNLKPGDTMVRAAASDDLAPVFNAGLTYNITPQWNLSSSVSYSLLKTTANITIDAADGTRLSTSRTKINLDPMVISLLVGYRFNL